MAGTSLGVPARLSAHSLTRRTALGGLAGGLATALGLAGDLDRERAAAQSATPTFIGTPGRQAALTDATLRDFEADVEVAMQTFQIPGAAVALVQGNEIVFNRGFGVRDLERGEPVTPRTRFRIASITKSMTALMLATLVDEGMLAWDDRAVDLWPAFAAPTPELTRTLRVRDLLGMASGVAESDTISLSVVEFFMMAGLLSASDVLRSVVDLPVIAPPDTLFSYNNTLYAVAAYLGLVAAGTAPELLAEAYIEQIRRRVFEPVGMSDAAILDDPRPLGSDFAHGYTRTIAGDPSPLPFVSLGGIGPAGSGLASATDMARYVITQMNGGVAPEGTRIASAENLAAMHQPGILLQPGTLGPPELRPDTVSLNYGMGWLVETFRDGRRLVWHSGGIDGFDSLVGFVPDAKIGFVVLTNSDQGALFYTSVQASLLGRLFGVNADLPRFLAEVVPVLGQRMTELASRAQPVDPVVIGPYLGLYEDGFRLRRDGAGTLYLDHDIRSMPVLALPDGSYLVAAGPEVALAQPLTVELDANGVPVMTISGFTPVRWLTGG